MTASTREVLDAIHRLRISEPDTELFQTFRPWAQTAAEVAAGITPVNYAYPPEDARRFGAIADGDGAGGGTNNYTALSNWLTVNAGRNAYLPPGIYRCDTGLAVPSDTFLSMVEATLDFTNTSNEKGLIFEERGGCLRGILIGPTDSFDADQKGISCEGINNSPAAPTYVDGPTIIETEIRNWGQYGCYFAYCNAPTVDKVYVHDIGYAGLGGVSVNDGSLTNSLIEDIGPGTSGDAYGCFWDRLEGTETVDPRSYRCIIQGCTFNSVIATGGNNGQAMDSHAGVDMVYCNNTVNNCQVGCAFVGSDVNGTPTLGPIRCQEFGNVYNLASQEGYGVILAGPYDSGTLQAPAVDCVLGPSIMEGGGIEADAIVGAYHLQGTRNCTVRIGAIKNPRCNGVLLYTDNVGFNVSGGTILDPYDDTVTVPSCVAVRGNNNEGYIGGITFHFEDSGLGTNVAVAAIYIHTGLSGLNINIGPCSFIGIAAARLSYIENTSTGMNANALYKESGEATVSLVNTNTVNNTAVTFKKRFPSAPASIRLTLKEPTNEGGKSPIASYGSVSTTGFTVTLRPYDFGSWTDSGDQLVGWEVTT